MQNIKLFNACEARKNLIFTFYIINRIRQIILHPAPLITLLKSFYFICNGDVVTASQRNACTQRHDDTLITSW